MIGKLGPGLLLLLFAGCQEQSQRAQSAAQTPYINRGGAFSLRAPPGWTLQDTAYAVWHYTDVFLLARNAQAHEITPLDAIQLPERGVVVMFAHSGFPRSCCEFYVDTVEDSVATLLRKKEAGWETVSGSPANQPGQMVERYQVGFLKWNEPWSIFVFARHPEEADRREVDDLLKSMVFCEVPVTLPGQALQLAYRALPAEARNPEGGVDLLRPDVTQRDSTFLVTFHSVDRQELAGRGSSGVALQSWSYSVSSDGTVTK